MPRFVKCKRCGYKWGAIDNEHYAQCNNCGLKVFLPARDFKEDYTNIHRGSNPIPHGENKVMFDYGDKKDIREKK